MTADPREKPKARALDRGYSADAAGGEEFRGPGSVHSTGFVSVPSLRL